MTNILFLLIGCFVLATSALAGEGCGHECEKCHSITLAEAKKALSGRGKLTVTDVRMSPSKGLWQILAERDHYKEIYYLDLAKKNLIVGTLVDIKGQLDMTRNAIEKATHVNVAEINLKNALLLGKSSARIKAYIFTDPLCPYCAKLHKELTTIVAKNPDIAFYIIISPLKGMTESFEKAKAILCASSLKLLEDVFDGKAIPAATCKSKQVDENMALTAKYGIAGAPSIVFQNGNVHFGYEKKERLLSLIKSNLQ